MTMATSFTIGVAIRKLIVTPSGTPAATNPMNAGTAEHEQNGVTTPSPAAATLPPALPALCDEVVMARQLTAVFSLAGGEQVTPAGFGLL